MSNAPSPSPDPSPDSRNDGYYGGGPGYAPSPRPAGECSSDSSDYKDAAPSTGCDCRSDNERLGVGGQGVFPHQQVEARCSAGEVCVSSKDDNQRKVAFCVEYAQYAKWLVLLGDSRMLSPQLMAAAGVTAQNYASNSCFTQLRACQEDGRDSRDDRDNEYGENIDTDGNSCWRAFEYWVRGRRGGPAYDNCEFEPKGAEIVCFLQTAGQRSGTLQCRNPGANATTARAPTSMCNTVLNNFKTCLTNKISSLGITGNLGARATAALIKRQTQKGNPCFNRGKDNYCNGVGEPRMANSTACVCTCPFPYTGRRCERLRGGVGNEFIRMRRAIAVLQTQVGQLRQQCGAGRRRTVGCGQGGSGDTALERENSFAKPLEIACGITIVAWAFLLMY